MRSWHIHIEGLVQGVGFRPRVFQLAAKMQLNGWVNNSSDGVHIEIDTLEHKAADFLSRLINNPPPLARITRYHMEEVAFRPKQGFSIVGSDPHRDARLILPPDLALCASCREELDHPENRRFNYPFTTCTNCGPRYSILESLPYDRINTSMSSFQMCVNCEREYNDPSDRRYYAQTNTCDDCAIRQILRDSRGIPVSEDAGEILTMVVEAWKNGRIVALKGIGGFLLTCDALNVPVIQRLRRLKLRPTKPLATMFPYHWLESSRISMTPREKAWLEHPSAPIVLISPEFGMPEKIPLSVIAPGMNHLGVMLPYTPLFYLLLKIFDQPIIATSGNISHAPIIYENAEAVSGLGGVADYIVENNRDILIPEDDSVIGFSKKSMPVIFRRSRGMAPAYIHPDLVFPSGRILAMGAMLKSTFCYLHQHQPYISQYLGDQENYDTQSHYRITLNHFLKLLKSKPELILTDWHPDYPSTHFGHDLGKQFGIPVRRVQHHKAHMAAVLAENNLLDSIDPILGVIWDGTGWGEDGQIWGGEFFIADQAGIRRTGALSYFNHIVGDKMAREPRISALSLVWEQPGCEHLREKFSEEEWRIYSRLLSREGILKTSSMGRVFDAVASILGCGDIQSYEGEAAALLEAVATRYMHSAGEEQDPEKTYDFGVTRDEEGMIRIDVSTVIRMILEERKAEVSAGEIALRFHGSLAKLIRRVAMLMGMRKIVFSGGVFQNRLLIDLIIAELEKDFQLFFHRELSPNDENISFGQLIYYITWEKIKPGEISGTNKKIDYSLEESTGYSKIIK